MNNEENKNGSGNVLGTQEIKPEIAGSPTGDVEKTASGIEIGDPEILKPKTLPLVVKLPADASLAQVLYSKILNSYAYQDTRKWKQKKDNLIKRLEMLKNVELPENLDKNLSINKSKISFAFIPYWEGGVRKEILANIGGLPVVHN